MVPRAYTSATNPSAPEWAVWLVHWTAWAPWKLPVRSLPRGTIVAAIGAIAKAGDPNVSTVDHNCVDYLQH